MEKKADAYQRTGVIHESPRSLVQRGVRTRDGLDVVIKSSAPRVPLADSIARLRNEWLITRMFDTPAIPRVVELVESTNHTALVFEANDQLLALDRRGADGCLSLAACLRVALGLVEALAEIHAKNVVHKDVKPANLLVDASLSQVCLIDFGIAMIVPRELKRGTIDARFEGTLGYLPPEQTGRVNRPVDYRSDYYGLGATLYWMLTGRRPFADIDDPDALVHALLTRAPAPVHTLIPSIPPVLSALVTKLLHTAAEERYQGSFGLRADLQRCLDALERTETIAPFELAARDPGERLRPPRRLYGRADELDAVGEALATARTNGPALVMLCGPSGSGKSAIVDEIRAGHDETAIVFAACKFDQFAQASPHAGAARLLETLLDQLLARAEVNHASLRERVVAALGRNGGLLTELVPALEGLSGGFEPVPRVGPAEARDRFSDTLQRFTEALLVPGHDFVVFIDDAQWADESSLQLIQMLCLGPTRRLTVILATRDDALDDDHPLPAMLAALDDAGFEPTTIELRALTLGAIEALVDDLLEATPDGPALAELLLVQTHGTPLFVTQLLMAYYAEGILDMDRSSGRWRVDMSAAEARPSSGGVVEFLVAQLEALAPALRHLLGVAACVGARFDVDTLAAAVQQPASTVAAALWDAVISGHLRSLGHAAAEPWVSEATRASGAGQLEYAFVHDRIQQVARESLVEHPAQLYLGLARRLSTRGEPSGAQLHRLAGYISHAIELIEAPAERARFARLCARAGAAAKQATGFVTAAARYRDALRLLDGIDGIDGSLFALHLAHAECLWMSDKLDAARREFIAAREQIQTPLDLPRLLLAQVTLAMVKGLAGQALDSIVEAAEAFDLDLRRGGDQAWIGARIAAVIGRIDALGDAAIVARPALTDHRQQIIAQLLISSTNAAYLSGDINLYAALGLATIELGLDHGIDDTTGIALAQLALVVASALGDYPGARRYTELGAAILERTPDSPFSGMADVIAGTTIQPWIAPMAGSIPLLERGFERGRSVGMFSTGAYAIFVNVCNSLMIGAPLPRVEETADRAINYLSKIGDTPLVFATQAHVVAARLLAEPSAPPADRGPLVELDADNPGAANPAALFVTQAVEALLATMLGEPQRVARAAAAAAPYMAAGTGLFPWILLRIVGLVAGCDTYATLDAAGRDALVAKIDDIEGLFDRWTRSCPENALPLRHLLAGAWAAARGQLAQARTEYTASADAAAAAAWHNFEGLANERGAAIALALDDDRAAIGFLEHARRAYARWGAVALERRVVARLRSHGFAPPPTTDAGLGTSHTTHTIDASSIVKMSVALSETTGLETAIAHLLETASQNAGADRSALLLTRHDTLELWAEHVVGEPVRSFSPALALADATDRLAVSVVRDCLRRREAVIIDDVTERAVDALDPYLQTAKLRALLVLPVIRQGQRVGVLYLENRLTPGAFTRQHLRVLRILAVQAAVTLDNARLFDALREREAQWRGLVESAPDTIMIIDRDHQIVFCNHLDGEPGEGLTGAALASLAQPAQRPRIDAALAAVFTTASTHAYDHARLVDGRLRRFTTRLGPIMRGAQVERIALISTDVSERYELEASLRQSQKMQAIGTLAGGVAHDFNNLLTIIMGATELGALALDDLEIPADSFVLDSFDEISVAAERAAKLTHQLLAFSRKQVLEPKHIELSGHVRSTSRMLERLIGADIELRVELASTPCRVHADPGQIEQVVMNLAINARDAMPRGGTLTIATALERVGLAADGRPAEVAPGDYATLTVRDTGLGMSGAVASRIFEPFFTTKGEGRGTGLGLSTVHGIVEQSGGHITVSSERGVGTEFRVYLPIDLEAREDDDDRHPAVDIGGRETVLVVEDEEAVAALVAKTLTARGYTVLVAYNSTQAMAHATAAPNIDLVFADIVLPGDNGRSVAEAVLERHRGARMLFTSGYTDDVIPRLDVERGGVSFLNKPFTPDKLAAAIRDRLDAPAGADPPDDAEQPD